MIKPDFTKEDLHRYALECVQAAEMSLVNVFKYVGQTFVRDARDNGNYRDRTGNLRSSIGYIILQDGIQIDENFEQAGSGTDKATGAQQGAEFAKDLAFRYPQGLILICVAGMEYAAAVEYRGYDVITGTSLQIEADLERLLSAAV